MSWINDGFPRYGASQHIRDMRKRPPRRRWRAWMHRWFITHFANAVWDGK